MSSLYTVSSTCSKYFRRQSVKRCQNHVWHLGPFFRNKLPSSRNIPVEKKSLQKSSLAPTKSSSASKHKNHQRKIPYGRPFPLTIELACQSQLITPRQPSGQSPTRVPPNFKRKTNTSPGFCRTPPAAHAWLRLEEKDNKLSRNKVFSLVSSCIFWPEKKNVLNTLCELKDLMIWTLQFFGIYIQWQQDINYQKRFMSFYRSQRTLRLKLSYRSSSLFLKNSFRKKRILIPTPFST